MKKTKEGKQTGYELRDGRYYIAQIYRDRFARLADESEAVDILVRSVLTHLEREGAAITRERRELWQAIRDDLGLPFGEGWAYDGQQGCIFEKPKEKGQP